MRSHLVRTLAPALVALLLNAGGATQGLTFAITSDQDSGQGTLRWAIEQANRVAAQASPGNRISLTFASGLAGRTVTLRSFLPYLLASHVTFAVAGTNPAPVTIDTGTGTGTVLVVTGDDVVFQDLVFHKPASSNFPGDNVILVGARGTRFVRCRFTNPVDAGIFAVGAPHTTVQDCRFETTGRGAGILAQDGSDHFRAERCTFSGFTNGAGFAAAGIADVVVRDSTFTGNRTALLLVEVCRSVVFGPGNRITGNLTMAIDASTVAPTRFEDPGDVGLRVTETTITGSGSSAILLQDRCTRVVIEKSVFDGNGANDGAAQIASVGCGSVTLVENVIRNGRGIGAAFLRTSEVVIGHGNHAYRNGGHGFSVDGTGLPARARVTIQSSAATNCAPNAAAGFMLTGVDATLVHVTAAGNNWGVFAHPGTSVRVANSILWGNRTFDRVALSGATATMTTSLFASGSTGSYGAWSGSGNHTGSGSNYPRFRDLAGDDVRLLSGSPALHAGDATDPALPAVDFEGEQRVLGPQVDLGADESDAVPALRVEGPCVRSAAGGLVTLHLAAGSAHAHRPFVLAASLSGTGSLPLGGGTVLPVQADAFTAAWLGTPSLALGQLDAQGTASKVVPVPREVVPFLPRGDLTFAFVTASDPAFASNPVIVSFPAWRN